jgi:hypothetical protein
MMKNIDIDLDNAISEADAIKEFHAFANHLVRKYSSLEADNDACRVYIDGMMGVPRSCASCQFIQIGDKSFGLYRCKLGVHFPYGFDYKKERAGGCVLRER